MAEHTHLIGRRIREEREKADLTQKELADAIPGKADGNQVSKWERGIHRPSDDTLEHIAAALGCPVAAFYAEPKSDEESPDLMGSLQAPNGSPSQLAALRGEVQGLHAKIDELIALATELTLAEAEREAS